MARARLVPAFLVSASALLAADLAGAVSRPLTVSPGDIERYLRLSASCPTFSWSAVGEAEGTSWPSIGSNAGVRTQRSG